MPAEQQFPNSYAQPTGYDAVLAAQHNPGDTELVIEAPCPPGALATGPYFQIGVGHTLFKVTDLGVDNLHWQIPDGPVELTTDDTYVIGTGVKLELTHDALEYLRTHATGGSAAGEVIVDRPVVRAGEIVVTGSLNSDLVTIEGGQAPPDFVVTEDGSDFVYEDVVFPPEAVTTEDNSDWLYED